MKDGESWCNLIKKDILGNAHMSNFFTNMKTIDELYNSLKCYKQAL